MSSAAFVAMSIAALVAGSAYFMIRTVLTASAEYRRHFETTANVNLQEMFLFIEPSRLFAVHAVFLLCAFFVVLLLGGSAILAVLTVAVLGASPPLMYWWLRLRRRQRAVQQLPDALLSIATNLRSGLSLNQSLETTIAYESPPLGQELGLVLRELRLGVSFAEAIDNFYQRLPEVEVQLVVSAMKVSREIGGNLSETLERISDTLRKRLQMEGKIRSLTAQGKLQGIVMVSLPVFLVVMLSQMQPAAMYYLFHAWYGWATVAVIVVMELIGYHFIYKIVNIDV